MTARTTFVAGIMGGALLGALSTSFGLIDMSLGGVRVTGGNEWTPFVIGAGVLGGGVLGCTSFFRRHAFSFFVLGLGLVFAIALRDAYALQPPTVFLDLFGLPVIGYVIGMQADRWRWAKNPSSLRVLLVGGIVAVLLAAGLLVLWNTTVDRYENCETMRGVTYCDLISLSG